MEHDHDHGAHGPESETAFLHVRGMHCTSCEDFIETVAASTEGIHEAEASYASNTAKVAYDPSRYDPSDLPLWSIARTRGIALRPEVIEGDERYE